MRYFVLFMFFAIEMLHSASIIEEIEKSIEFLRAQPGMKYAISALSILNTKTGETLFEENQEFSLTPASLMKVITTGAALHLLGPEFRFETELAYEGSIDTNGVLHGNIVLIGGGDPTLGSSEFPGVDPWEKQIEHWIQMIKNSGVKTIAGSVVGDGSVYESHFISSDGTLGDVLAKTGSMSQVKNYAGYFKAENGDLFAFALIANQCSSNAKKRNMNLEILLSNLIELDPS